VQQGKLRSQGSVVAIAPKKNAHLKRRWAQNQSAELGLELEIVAGTSNDHGFIKINFGVGNRIAN